MSLTWYLVRNHEKGKMRSGEEIGAELDAKLAEFESISGVVIDDLLREVVGVGPWIALGESPANYSHPIARIEAHGPVTFILLAVPSSLHNGISDFTNVLMVAHPLAIVTVIRDPAHAFAADFGGRLLTDYSAHIQNKRTFTAGEAVFRATRSCVLSFEASLTTLRATIASCFDNLRAIELRQLRVGQDFDELEAEFGKTYAELRSMTRTPSQIHEICDKIEQWSLSGAQEKIFDENITRQVNVLRSKISQVDAIMGTFISDIERAIKRCDDVSKRELLDAQRRNTYWTSALLLPNLIFAFFGQSFLGDVREGTFFWWISGSLLGLYGLGSIYFVFKDARQGKR